MNGIYVDQKKIMDQNEKLHLMMAKERNLFKRKNFFNGFVAIFHSINLATKLLIEMKQFFPSFSFIHSLILFLFVICE